MNQKAAHLFATKPSARRHAGNAVCVPRTRQPSSTPRHVGGSRLAHGRFSAPERLDEADCPFKGDLESASGGGLHVAPWGQKCVGKSTRLNAVCLMLTSKHSLHNTR